MRNKKKSVDELAGVENMGLDEKGEDPKEAELVTKTQRWRGWEGRAAASGQ